MLCPVSQIGKSEPTVNRRTCSTDVRCCCENLAEHGGLTKALNADAALSGLKGKVATLGANIVATKEDSLFPRKDGKRMGAGITVLPCKSVELSVGLQRDV